MFANRPTRRRGAFTLIELLVVIAIIIALAALAAGFMPNISDSQNLTRSVDQLEQWLLTARMRAKRDGLATGLRFTPDPTNPGMFSEVLYIQQPDPLSGGVSATSSTPGAYPYSPTPSPNPPYYKGGLCIGAAKGTVQFVGVDFTNGQPGLTSEYLVQLGDYLELYNGGGVHLITGVPSPNTLQLTGTAYDANVTVSAPTTNYRILRQPRLLVGESPLQLPGNYVVDANPINGAQLSNIPFRSVPGAPIGWSGAPPWPQPPVGGYYEILFAPSGAVIGQGASNGKVYFYVHDVTQADPTKAGIVAVQTRTGFIGAYNVAPGADPLFFAEEGRSSGL